LLTLKLPVRGSLKQIGKLLQDQSELSQ